MKIYFELRSDDNEIFFKEVFFTEEREIGTGHDFVAVESIIDMNAKQMVSNCVRYLERKDHENQ